VLLSLIDHRVNGIMIMLLYYIINACVEVPASIICTKSIEIIKIILIRSFRSRGAFLRVRIMSNGIRRQFVFQRLPRRTLSEHNMFLFVQNPPLNDFVRPPPLPYPSRHGARSSACSA